MSRFRPQRAESLGLILHYECTNRCAHCLYACRPGLQEEVASDAWDRLLDALGDSCPGTPVHVGGGEPFLNLAGLVAVVEGLGRRGIPLEYVETNGYWVKEPQAMSRLEAVRRAGCDCMLLSISPFHNAFLSCRDNEHAYRMIVDTFGPNGIFPWHPGHYPFLRRVDPSRPVPFAEYARHFQPGELEYELTGISYLHPAGRAASTLAGLFGRCQPAGAWLDKRCALDLASPVHAHIDASGRYLTGFCSGLQIGDRQALELARLYEEGISLGEYPVLEMLVRGGLAALFHSAARQGFSPDPAGYVSACHLCGHVRTWFFLSLPEEKRPRELAPRFFYEELAALSRQGETSNRKA